MHKKICAWCNSTLQDGILPVSHSICPQCLSLEKAELERISRSSNKVSEAVLVYSEPERKIMFRKIKVPVTEG